MKRITCPRCDGLGEIEEDETLIGLAPFQDRPSAVDDTEWSKIQARGDMEPTAIAQVPVFRVPDGLKKRDLLKARELVRQQESARAWRRALPLVLLVALGAAGYVERRTVSIYWKYIVHRYWRDPLMTLDV